METKFKGYGKKKGWKGYEKEGERKLKERNGTETELKWNGHGKE